MVSQFLAGRWVSLGITKQGGSSSCHFGFSASSGQAKAVQISPQAASPSEFRACDGFGSACRHACRRKQRSCLCLAWRVSRPPSWFGGFPDPPPSLTDPFPAQACGGQGSAAGTQSRTTRRAQPATAGQKLSFPAAVGEKSAGDFSRASPKPSF